ncbi:MAG: ABC transporter permease subunit, partial [Chloroflexota bacterium]
ALHIAPNFVAPFLVVLTAQVGWAIVVEASLGFLGMGVPPPTPTWGQMLSGSLMAIQTAWWEPFFPGLAISLVVFGFNLFGDALRDLLDPRLRGNP